MDKYIIKNCPAIYGAFTDGCKKDHYEDGSVLCQDCTDCVMKQIVELCKDKMDTEFNSGSIFAEEILNLLQIEEIK